MKKAIVIIALFFSLNATAQKPDTTFNDSTKFISITGIQKYLATMQDKLSYKQFNDFVGLLQGLVDSSKKDWIDEKRKKK